MFRRTLCAPVVTELAEKLSSPRGLACRVSHQRASVNSIVGEKFTLVKPKSNPCLALEALCILLTLLGKVDIGLSTERENLGLR